MDVSNSIFVEYMENTTIIAIIISICAGLSTAIGGLIVFFSNIKNVIWL